MRFFYCVSEGLAFNSLHWGSIKTEGMSLGVTF